MAIRNRGGKVISKILNKFPVRNVSLKNLVRVPNGCTHRQSAVIQKALKLSDKIVKRKARKRNAKDKAKDIAKIKQVFSESSNDSVNNNSTNLLSNFDTKFANNDFTEIYKLWNENIRK